MAVPQIWHYGLVARDWAEFITDIGDDGAYFRKMIERSGEPALDLGCGSGRLLIPFLQDGLDVDGCDASSDMLAVCQERLEAEGLKTSLANQANHELDLHRRYKTIFACGVIGLGGDKRMTRRSMELVYEHMRPGGTFVFDYHAPWNDPGYWNGWLPENRRTLPLDWFPPERKTLADGDELETAVQIFSQDPLEEVAVRRYRARLWRDGKIIKEEIYPMMMEDFSKSELMLLLEIAGFSDVQLFGDHSDEPATMDHEHLIFVARK